MAATTFGNTGLNTFPTSVSGGTVPTDNQIRLVHKWAMHLAPNETPFQTAVPKGPALDQRKVEFGQSYRTATTSSLDGAITSTTATTFNVAAGDGKLYKKYDVLAIIDYMNQDPLTGTLDYDSKELVWLPENPTGDTITVVRAQGGTSASTFADNAHVELVGTAMTQVSDFQISPFTRGTLDYNYFQRFQGGALADRAARKMPTYETKGDQLLADIEEEQKRLKIQLEKSMWIGGRQAGSASSPEMMNGVDAYIQTNRIDAGGAVLSPYDLEDVTADLWEKVGDEAGKAIWMNMKTARIFDSLLNPIRRATVQDTTINTTVERVRLRTGDYTIKHTRHVPDGKIYILNINDISLHNFKGHNWQTFKHSTDGPYDWISLWGEFTLVVQREAAMAVIENFDTDLANYPRREYF